MKKYIVIEIQKLASGQIANLVTSHDSRSEAESKYHLVLSSAAISDLPCHGAVLIDDTCTPIAWESYTNTPEEEE